MLVGTLRRSIFLSQNLTSPITHSNRNNMKTSLFLASTNSNYGHKFLLSNLTKYFLNAIANSYGFQIIVFREIFA